jgi:hypothetical protein
MEEEKEEEALWDGKRQAGKGKDKNSEAGVGTTSGGACEQESARAPPPSTTPGAMMGGGVWGSEPASG